VLGLRMNRGSSSGRPTRPVLTRPPPHRLTLSAATGATVAELMHRAGYASPAAALRYQHATEDRDRVIADALGGLATVTLIGARDARAMGQSEPSTK
jgi:hypothetical protein